MFCPNCGAQNSESATTCQKCNFNLKGAAAPKFKGTMLMMNQPPLPDMPGVPAAPGAPPAAPVPAAAPAAPVAPPMPPRIKGTMVGMAPPPEMFGQSPSTSQPVVPFAPPATPPPAAPPAQSPVNPLGGTLAVDQLNFGAFPGGEPPGAPQPPAPVFGAPQEPAAPAPPFGGDAFGGGGGQANQGGYGGFAPPAAGDVGQALGSGYGAAAGAAQQGVGHAMQYGGGQQQPGPGYGPPPGGGFGAPGGFGGPPGYGGGGEPVNTQTALILAFVSIFCGCPGLFAGIPIFFAFQAKTLAEQGQHEEARAKVKLVKIIVFTGMGLYVVSGLVWFLVVGLALLSR